MADQKVGAETGTTFTPGTMLDEQAVASQLGLTTAQVIEFCQGNALPRSGTHYEIPADQVQAIKQWAASAGYLSNR